MIKKKMYKRIKAYKRQGYTRKEIVSEMEIDPKTVTKYCRMDEKEFQSYRSEIMFRDKVLDKYEKDILEIYEKNEFKKLNMSSVYDYLEERYGNLPGNEKTLRNFISYLLQTDKLTLNKNIRAYTKVPELPFGKQMQLDFGQFRCRRGFKIFILFCLALPKLNIHLFGQRFYIVFLFSFYPLYWRPFTERFTIIALIIILWEARRLVSSRLLIYSLNPASLFPASSTSAIPGSASFTWLDIT